MYIKHGKNISHPDFPHGKFSGWRAGCRCHDCVQANRDYKREYTRNLRLTSVKYRAAQAEDKARYRKTTTGIKVQARCDKARRKTILKCDNHKLILEIYETCPVGYEVDHIIPICRGGVHTPDNLQYLPVELNRRKSNRLDFDYQSTAIPWKLLLKPSTTSPQGRTSQANGDGNGDTP